MGRGFENSRALMSPSRPFIMRPVATSLLMAAIMLAGIVAFRFLSLSALPEVDYPTIQVQTFYPGASPDVMGNLVTAPLERQLGEMPGLKRMCSNSSGGASVITLQFNLTLPLDVAEQEVQAAINAAYNLLPADPPGFAGLRQGQPGGRADSDARADLQYRAADPGRGSGRYAPRPEDFPDRRSRAGLHLGRPTARRCASRSTPRPCRPMA